LRLRRWQSGTTAIALLIAIAGCATKQPIAIDCVPEEVVIYVDGERIDGVPEEIKLRRDRPHTLFFKGPGLEPELVVLNSTKVDGDAALEPAEVCVHPRYKRVGRTVQIEIAPDVSAGPPGAANPPSTIEIAPRPEFEADAP
jgi:hypothetical protein